MNFATIHDVAGSLDAQTAFVPVTFTGAAASNGQPIDGPVFDRFTPYRELALGGALVLFGTAAIDAGRTLTLEASVWDDDLVTFTASPRQLASWGPTAVLSAGGALLSGTPWRFLRSFDLQTARRYLRATVTATLSGGGASQTIELAGVYILSGQQQQPILQL